MSYLIRSFGYVKYNSALADDAVKAVDADQERSQRHARVLRRLAEIGMNLAEAVDLQRQEDGADPADLAMKFARIAKAVRQTLALEARLGDEDRARRTAAEYRRKVEQDRLASRAKNERAIREAQARDIVERATLSEPPDPDSETYTAEMAEWLFDETEDEFNAYGAAQAIIPEICRLLGLRYDRDAMEAPLADALDQMESAAPDFGDLSQAGDYSSPQVEMHASHPP